MIHMKANTRRAVALSDDLITTGSVGIEVEILCSEAWDGLTKTVLFRGSGSSVDVILTGDSCTVPPEVLTVPGGELLIGLYGTDGSGSLSIPTVWADAGRILQGAAPSGIAPTPSQQSALDQAIAALNAATEEIPEQINAAVEEAIQAALEGFTPGQTTSEELKQALLQLARKVAYIDDQGETYYQDLYDALYPPAVLASIRATFAQGSTVIYNTDSLDVLKPLLTVTAVYDDGSTETVPAADYTLSGTLATGISTITASYQGKTATFQVTVTAAPMAFPVTNNLTNCSTSNSAAAVMENEPYSAVITPASGYTLTGASVVITMAGSNITASAYSNGVINIARVTGALVISIVAQQIVLSSISAAYTQSGVVYNTDTLDSLKDDLVVTAAYSDGTSTVLAADAYTLSGTLTAGTSTITVSYGGKSTTFQVIVTAAPQVYLVTNELTGCTTDNSAASVVEGSAYAARITASTGYTLVGAVVTITMGGQDITASAYSGGVISIPAVTGALVISVAAVAVVLSSISAVYTQSGVVYNTDTLDSLKDDLVVTAAYSDSSTQTVPAANYTLSGTLTEGTSTITVSYGGKTATFNVTVSVGLDSIAYGTKTYRDIFITDNVLGWFGDFESDFEVKSEYTYLYPTEPHGSGYKLAPNASASPSVSTSEYNSPGHSIDVSSSGATKYMSAYTNGNVAFGEDYIFAFACKVPSYSAGKVELQAFGNTSTVIRAIQAAETNGWTPVLVIGAPVEGSTSGLLNFNFGALGNTTYGNPNFTAYMDDLVCTPLPDGMTQEQALTAFAKYLEIRRNA